MNRRIMALSLVGALLLLAACAPTPAEVPASQVAEGERADVDVLVYASPL